MSSSVHRCGAAKLLRSLLALTVVAALAAAAAPAGATAAGRPDHFSDSGTSVDAFFSEMCGVEITVTFSLRETTVFFEKGSEYPHQHLVQNRATISGPGGSLIVREAYRAYDTGDSSTVTGLPLQILNPDGGVILRDAGSITFNEDGTSIVHGPHPGGNGEFDFQSLCSYLV